METSMIVVGSISIVLMVFGILRFLDSTRYWVKYEFNSNGNRIYYENSDGFWVKRKFDSNGNIIYLEDSNGYWVKKEFDSNNNLIYRKDSLGTVNYYQSPCENKVIEIEGVKYKLNKL